MHDRSLAQVATEAELALLAVAEEFHLQLVALLDVDAGDH
jgi:hypothetical protein